MRIPARVPVAAVAAAIMILAAGATPASAAGQRGTPSATVRPAAAATLTPVAGSLKRYTISGVTFRRSERENRAIDHDEEGSMEVKKREGYF